MSECENEEGKDEITISCSTCSSINDMGVIMDGERVSALGHVAKNLLSCEFSDPRAHKLCCHWQEQYIYWPQKDKTSGDISARFLSNATGAHVDT